MNLKGLLSLHGVISGKFPEDEKFVEGLKLRKKISILYGETFDKNGTPIDSIKYYFFVDQISRKFKEEGVKNTPVVLIADLGVLRNMEEGDTPEIIKRQANERYNWINKIKEVYGCNFEVKFMSDISKSKSFKETFNMIKKFVFNDPHLLQLVEKTVPEDKIIVERERGYIYSLEELTTIWDVDLKIGPPREMLYDNVVREIKSRTDSPPMYSIYLMPTYPLGMRYGEYLSSPIIKKYGLTPYKAGSKGFVSNRVILGRTTPEMLRKLIDDTQISPSPKKPNPIFDLIVIGSFAKYYVEGGEEVLLSVNEIYRNYYAGKMPSKELKELAYNLLSNYIFEILGW